jgi:hypothetical protein
MFTLPVLGLGCAAYTVYNRRQPLGYVRPTDV